MRMLCRGTLFKNRPAIKMAPDFPPDSLNLDEALALAIGLDLSAYRMDISNRPVMAGMLRQMLGPAG